MSNFWVSEWVSVFCLPASLIFGCIVLFCFDLGFVNIIVAIFLFLHFSFFLHDIFYQQTNLISTRYTMRIETNNVNQSNHTRFHKRLHFTLVFKFCCFVKQLASDHLSVQLCRLSFVHIVLWDFMCTRHSFSCSMRLIVILCCALTSLPTCLFDWF